VYPSLIEFAPPKPTLPSYREAIVIKDLDGKENYVNLFAHIDLTMPSIDERSRKMSITMH